MTEQPVDWGQGLGKRASEQSDEAEQGREDNKDPGYQSNVQLAPTASPDDELSQTSDDVGVDNRNSELQRADIESDRSQLTSPEIIPHI